ncbi:hypothetical protein MPLSOD_410036 [Mesorhizobium sp. SOD10]|nr:hypothetical protein MPLSOD_410036 [Mesorhizobium sp. SOD10]
MQQAASKNIAALEASTGTRLFIREKSKLRLNAEGESLHRAVQLSVLTLETAIDQISRRSRKGNEMTLSMSTAFAAHWLIPQMEDVRRAFLMRPWICNLLAVKPSARLDTVIWACDSGIAPTTANSQSIQPV